jgi:hypothetical protein
VHCTALIASVHGANFKLAEARHLEPETCFPILPSFAMAVQSELRARNRLAEEAGSEANLEAEVHAGWCSPRTSNPVVPILSGRSVRFRHTSANFPHDGFARSNELFSMSSRKPRKLKPFRATKEVKRRARIEIGSPPPVQRHQDRKRKPPKHKKRAREQAMDSF